MTTLAPETAAAFDQLLEPSRRSDVPGYVVAVAREGRTIYRQASGMASIEFAVANTPATRIRIASVTKQFTGLAVMLLVEDGRLDIDKPVRHYLPELGGPNGAPTLRQLLNHTGGIRDALESVAFFLTEGLFPLIPAGLTHAWSSRFSDGNFAPGEAWSYSNYGYMLLSRVIEKVSGLTLAECFRQRLFEPLGMNDSELVPSDMDIAPGVATSHIRMPDGRFRRGIYPCEELVGGGGIVSTVDDMLRWAANLREPHRLGSRASWDEILRPVDFADGAQSTYGFGIKRQIHRGVEMLWHDGSTFGSRCALFSFPEHALDIIVLANRSDAEPAAIALKIAEALLADAFGPAKQFADAAGREALAGQYYSTATKRLFGIRVHADKLPGKLMFAIDASPQGLLWDDAGTLRGESTAGPLVVRHAPPQGSSTVAQIELELCGRRETYTRLPDTAPSAEALAADLVGEYRLQDFDTPVWITFDDGQLCIDLRSRFQPNRIQLAPLSADVLLCTAAMLGAPGVQGTVALQRENGAVSGFFFSLQRTWNLRFARV
ncbi:MAG TPA: serine hydrolase domain-containing protein [Solimonas sp.]|nr:serine hydrolase domain-containing protein [Solimonas sp.]